MAPTLTSASDYLETKILDHVFRGVTYTPPENVWLALFTSAPSDSGGGTQVGDRQVVSFAAASGRSAATEADVTFTGVIGSVSHVGVFDAQTGGNLLSWGAVDEPVDPAGDDLLVSVGGLVVAFADGYMSDFLAAALLDHVLRSESYSPPASVVLALLDDAGSEFSGGSYARETVTFGAAAGGSIANTALTEFTGLAASTWAAGRAHEDAGSGGRALWEWPVAPKPLSGGSSLRFDPGSVVATLD